MYINTKTMKFPYLLRDLKRDNPKVSFPSDIKKINLKKYNVVEVIDKKPKFNRKFEDLQKNPIPIKDVDNWKIEYTVVPKEVNLVKQNLLKELNWKAREKEEEGITINGKFIDTRRKTQTRITQAVLQAQLTPDITFDWKNKNGIFETLTADYLIEVSKHIAKHVQTVFTREKELTEQINSCTTIEELKNIDLTF